MIEIVNQKYIPVTLHVDGESKTVDGRGSKNNRLKLNVDELEHLPAHVKDLIAGGYVTAKKIISHVAQEVKQEVSDLINEVEGKNKK